MREYLNKPWFAALLIGLAAQLLFSVNVTRPTKVVFDETHYVPAARTLLALERPTNTEHPLLGKEIIAAGIAVFGDNSLGWRAFSTIAGTATVLGVFAILLLLWGSIRTAAFGAGFAALNFTLFIQARIAMLDVFMGAFAVGGIAALLWSMGAPGPQVERRWIAGAALLGLATATKWTAAPYVAFAALAFLYLRERYPQSWPGLSLMRGMALLALVSVGTYFFTFLPALSYANDALTLPGLIPYQWEMYRSQTQVLTPHSYQSDWWSWPLLIRPIWYLYEPVDGAVRGILLVGNPAIMWGGLVAIGVLGWAWWKGSAKAGGVAALWAASLAIWAVIPKSLGFYYYYHLSGLFLCIALASAFHLKGDGSRSGCTWGFTAAAVFLFVHFYPIISAAALPNDQAFNRWMWFASWR